MASGSTSHGNIGGVHIGKRLGAGPYELCSIDLDRGQDARNQADEDRGQENIALGILGFLRESGYSVKSYVGQHRQRSSAQHGRNREGLRIVERPGEEGNAVVGHLEDVASSGGQKNEDYNTHGGCESVVDAGRGSNPKQIEPRKQRNKQDYQYRVRNLG